MVSLQHIAINKEYRSLRDNIARDFYIPLLQEAITYKRAVGFFSSTILIEISKGILGLVKNDGKMQLIASPRLTEEDSNAIRSGYSLRETIKGALLRELKIPSSPFEEERLNFLANLIANETLDVRIAFTNNQRNIGMYHEKMGLIEDAAGNTVAFSGSMNETYTALSVNYEAIDVFCSWRSLEEKARVDAKRDAFKTIWENREANVTVFDFTEVKKEIIDKYLTSPLRLDIAPPSTQETIADIKTTTIMEGPTIPSSVELYDYQEKAIAKWKEKKFRGIFDMATGTGKTFTGLGALTCLSTSLKHHLAVIIVCPYQHLVEQWAEDAINFNINPIIGHSSSPQKNWKHLLEQAILDQKLKVKGKNFFCLICTNATFASDSIQALIKKIRSKILLVVDEAHNFGAESFITLLTEKFDYRLALSATIERHNDEVGTSRLMNYFGPICIEYPLCRAINEDKLTKYKYFPVICSLNDFELEHYERLTFEIGKCIIGGPKAERKISERGKRLALERARLIAGAEDKLVKLEEVIAQYVDKKHLLVYCGATRVLAEGKDYIDVEEHDIRQIDAVSNLLGNKLNMRISQFTSNEDMAKRRVLKEEFAVGRSIQALIAIKCLDEGVNIPQIRTAFILASTTNPKEYIQRRGRILRKDKGKGFAELYDFITLPYELNKVSSLTQEQLERVQGLVKNEMARAVEFSNLAMNMSVSQKILDSIKDSYSINENCIMLDAELS